MKPELASSLATSMVLACAIGFSAFLSYSNYHTDLEDLIRERVEVSVDDLERALRRDGFRIQRAQMADQTQRILDRATADNPDILALTLVADEMTDETSNSGADHSSAHSDGRGRGTWLSNSDDTNFTFLYKVSLPNQLKTTGKLLRVEVSRTNYDRKSQSMFGRLLLLSSGLFAIGFLLSWVGASLFYRPARTCFEKMATDIHLLLATGKVQDHDPTNVSVEEEQFFEFQRNTKLISDVLQEAEKLNEAGHASDAGPGHRGT